MIERAFARTLRNYSTIFFVVAIVSFPVHTLYSFAFRDVIATRDHQEVIESGDGRRVGSVGSQDLDNARIAYWIIIAVELALVPLAIRATRRVFVAEEEGSVPTATDAWSAALSPGSNPPRDRAPLAAAGVGVAVTVGIGILVHLIAASATGFLSDGARWVGVGLGQGLVRAAAVPLALGSFALFRAKDRGSPAPKF